MSLASQEMPNSKTTQKRRGSTDGSGAHGPAQKAQRTAEKSAAGSSGSSSNAGSSSSALQQLARLSTIVADSADFEAIKEFSPTDATTNPTLVLQAVSNSKYKNLFQKAINEAQEASKGKDLEATVEEAVDRVLVGFGMELLEIIPGLVSTEIPAELSFDTEGSVARARRIIELYKSKGISKDRILIKVAATWEGIQAAKQLKEEGINCNITLLFSLCQAVAASEAGAFLVSPFVGRILDWHKKANPEKDFAAAEDPGVKSVSQIYNYFKHFASKTVVMAASFRNTDEILQLAGCDKLTISPKLLQQLQQMGGEVSAKLSVQSAKKQQIAKLHLDEKTFRWMLNEDAMATEKLAEGIRNFAADMNKLKDLIRQQLQ
ncbi:transaldolase, putative [Eimeria tenella]|uniref:Transaldolase n=1 Tax=Eimeria tenella TaxID=5802 RepID=U6L0I8_EIMTE|nr:transaldolase, putative [Eimeria tenella]CDJ41280.1 transaldolase, putative [Eimeria tenella]|eukprot:XP_013232030.1 transaldolase, putative [Eimeria tenella]